ncbi:hypothetical protein HRW14_18860 [Streptomyces lunaelactis]|nr:hypothetical protein [Streptomyces lunaelactis]NUK24039.1 hypothetical protein [Streptomyces lunaelactis]NUK52301.1 hypothetical protein [Streptomyces lunaelactis]NUK63968.1 hypothetical protein [Streptomyces lunaelactis]NUK85709.1 hypothetical protein [Streptomyces lunaelactis]
MNSGPDPNPASLLATVWFAGQHHLVEAGGRVCGKVPRRTSHRRARISTRTEADELDPNKHMVLPAAGGTDVLGVVFDEQGAIPTRGRFAAWSPKAGTRKNIVGFFDTLTEATDAIGELREEPAAETERVAEPKWQTLKGVTATFEVYVKQSDGRIWPAGDRRTPTGEPVRVTRLEMRSGLRYGYTADEREIRFSGADGLGPDIGMQPIGPSANSSLHFQQLHDPRAGGLGKFRVCNGATVMPLTDFRDGAIGFPAWRPRLF